MQNLSIVIVNYKGWSSLKECLDSLVSYTNSTLLFEVIIVDNCSNDGFFESFQKKYPSFNFIINTGNNGFANGCNLGAGMAKFELLLFLNPDTVIIKKSLDIFVTDYNENPKIAVLSCLQIDENNKLYRQKNLFPRFFSFFGIPRAIYKIIYKNTIEKSFNENQHFFYPEWVTGAVVLINKKWLTTIGGWSENYWMYMEDVDLCKRISAKQGLVAVTKNCTIFHQHGGASRINIQTKALTKTEVIISKHTYISNHFSKKIGLLLQLRLFAGVFFEKLILSLISIPFFFNDNLKVNRFILENYMIYLVHVATNKTVLSPRSTTYNIRKKKKK